VSRKTWNPVILLGIVLGASLGGIIALILIRRSKQSTPLGLRDIPWRDLILLSGPIIALVRGLIQMSRRELPAPNTL
jgi:MFS family permease